MKKFLNEFKTFAMRGNVIDMAVGIIIGGAFGKIVSSLVSDIIMPPIGMLIGGINFTEWKIQLSKAVIEAGQVVKPAVTLNIGNFIQTVFDFVIIAFSIFLMVKAINDLSKKKESEEAPAPPAPTKEETLLTEIRDILKNEAAKGK
ncbi:MAG: large-conductance mechanosensitive channel protein MscL [Bacteroidales bacterium]|jgi:large conductance mechanosensitive channel|nr:large-conductance mechanosensitive channel protein MscL [Bacteroidales bacterium]